MSLWKEFLNTQLTNKEKNLIKGALRRIFSRSDLRRKAVDNSTIPGYSDNTRPRVKKWSLCPECSTHTPTYQMEVDHISPIIQVQETLDMLDMIQLVDRIWCSLSNLIAICKPCHKIKTKLENKQRRLFKKNAKRLDNP